METNWPEPEVDQAIDVVHPKEVPGFHLCWRQAETKKDHSNNQLNEIKVISYVTDINSNHLHFCMCTLYHIYIFVIPCESSILTTATTRLLHSMLLVTAFHESHKPDALYDLVLSARIPDAISSITVNIKCVMAT